MAEDAERERACRGKHRYANEHNALGAALKLHRRDGAAMSAYQCPLCGGWHVGHTPRRLRALGVGTREVR